MTKWLAFQNTSVADLRRHRLIRMAASFSIDDEDALLAIRPTILGIISDDMLAAALEADGTDLSIDAQEDAP